MTATSFSTSSGTAPSPQPEESKQPTVTLTLPPDVHNAFVKAAKVDDRPLSKFLARFIHAAHLKHGTTVS